MNKILLLAMYGLWNLSAASQIPATMRIENLKDGWNNPVTYVGEVENGKPNGLGMFIYATETTKYHAGSFADGLPEGKGVLFLDDTSFLWGNWQKGKTHGKGTNLSSNRSLYVGEYSNGEKEGKGTYFSEDNSIIIGNFTKGYLEGRAIFIDGTGKSIADNIYKEGAKNGPGYQYELKNNTLFKGDWDKGKWKGAAEVPFNSFLADKRFTGHDETNWTLMGMTNSNGKIHDSAYFRDNEIKKRYFGIFNSGELINGIVLEDDVSIFMGKRNAIGSTGPTTFYNRGINFGEGNFKDNVLTGSPAFFINFEEQKTYYGDVDETGDFSGKGWLTNSYISLSKGDFSIGEFEGSGWRIDVNGYCAIGTWYMDDLRELTLLIGPDGKPVNLAPTSLEKAITELANMYPISFDQIDGESIELENTIFTYTSFTNTSFYKILPESSGDYVINNYYNTAHISELYVTNKADAAIQAEKLSKQLTTMPFLVKSRQTPIQLTNNYTKPLKNKEGSITVFSFSEEPGDFFTLAKVMVVQKKDKQGAYHVMLAVGSEKAFDGWLGKD